MRESLDAMNSPEHTSHCGDDHVQQGMLGPNGDGSASLEHASCIHQRFEVHDPVPHSVRASGPGRLFGVSLGPGDPGLMTRAAWAALARRDTIWIYPVRSGKTPSYALDIALRAGLVPVAEHRAVVFPMTHDADKLARAWMNGAQTVLPWLQAGRDVMFLVEGDASTYATFGHLARTVRTLDARIQTPVLSGVNAFTAACASVGEAVAEQDDTVAVVPAAYGVKVLDRLLPDFDTLVLMKIKPLIDELLDWLDARSLLERAHFIERVGAPDERTLSGRDLLQLRGTKVNYLSLMVIRSHHRVRGERIRGCLKKSPASTASSVSSVDPVDLAADETPASPASSIASADGDSSASAIPAAASAPGASS